MSVPRLSALGDSITAASGSWFDLVSQQYSPYGVIRVNHAVGGQSIMGHMDAQTAAAASDDADLIFEALGANDVDAGDMAALQAKVETNLIAIKASNPRARIVYMNVLPCWTDASGSLEQDKSHIRAAIAAACAALGVECVDRSTWINVTDTADGVHPTSAGHQKISTATLAAI